MKPMMRKVGRDMEHSGLGKAGAPFYWGFGCRETPAGRGLASFFVE
jgi:hypothetical protein